jgi:hypothetical protein
VRSIGSRLGGDELPLTDPARLGAVANDEGRVLLI